MDEDASDPNPIEWRVIAEKALSWREWDRGCTLFNRVTGETHFLDLTGSYLLRLLEVGAVTIPNLAARTASELERDCDETWRALVAQTVQNFESMGVVESLSAGTDA